MPNYNKSFNFRNGVQVDEDNFYINANGLVGIGTTIPRYTLDLRGDAYISGLTTTTNLNVSGVATFNQISVGSSINLYASSGVITAVKYYGDGSQLTNIPTSQWIDVDPGAEFVTIYSKGIVGIGTTNPSLPYILTVGQNPETVDPGIIPSGGVGINSFGSIKATGIITAGQFVGGGGGITNVNASNISFGTLNTARLPSQIYLPIGIATIRDVVVSSAATIAGVSTFTDQGLVSKSINSSEITGNSVYITSLLDITTTGALKFSGDGKIYVGSDFGSDGQFLISRGSNGVAWANDISITGVATVGLLTATTIWNSQLTTTADLLVTSGATIDSLTVRKITSSNPTATNELTRILSGIITTNSLNSSYSVTGITTGTLFDGQNLNISGVGTIGTLHSGNIRLNVETNTLNTVGGDLNLAALSSVVNVQDNLEVDGSSILTGIATISTGLLPNQNSNSFIGSASKSFGEAYIDDVRIGVTATNQIDTRSGNLLLDSSSGTVNIKDNLLVDENLSVSGSSILTGIATFSTGLLPNQNSNSFIGSESKSFGEAHIDDVRIGVTATNQIDTRIGELVLDSTAGTVRVQDSLKVENNLIVEGTSTISGNITISGNLTPNDNVSSALGSATNRFTQAHIGDITLGDSLSNKISTRSGNLILDSFGGTVEVDDNLDVNNSLNVDGNSYLSGITTVGTTLLPNTDNSVAIGSKTKVFSEAHIDIVQIGLPSAAGIISTRSGNLSLDSFTRKVTTSQDLSVGRNIEISGIATVTDNLVAGSDFLPSNNLNSSIGSENRRFSEAHINDIRLGLTVTNQIDTRSGNLILDSFGGTVEVDDNLDVNNSLNVDGNAYITGIATFATNILPNDTTVSLGSASKTFSAAHIDNVQIGFSGANEIDTSSGNLILDSSNGTVEVDDNLDVNNSLNVDGNANIAGIATVATSLLPNSNNGSSLGSLSKSFASAYISDITLGAVANQINTRSGNLTITAFTGLINLQNNVIISDQLNVSGFSTFVKTVFSTNGILPSSNLASYLGSGTTSFGSAHVGNVNIANVENNTISTKSGDLKLTSSTSTTRVLNKLIVDELTELSGITSITTGLIPTTDKTAYLGSSNYAFGSAHINNVRVAVADTSVIDTVTGDLILQSNSNYVYVNDNLVVGNGLTVTNNVSAGPLFVNSVTSRIGIGTTNPQYPLDLVSSDANINLSIRTLSQNNFPSLRLSSGINTAIIQFNELLDRSLIIKNETPGSIIQQLHSGNSGINTGNHVWRYKNDDLMTLTYKGKLGIGQVNPIETFEVVGTSTVTSDAWIGGDLEVSGNCTIFGDFNADFTGKNFNIGVVTATKFIAITSVTSGDDTYVNRTLFVDKIRKNKNATSLVFEDSTISNYDSNYYGPVGINSGYNLNVYDNGSLIVGFNSVSSIQGVGTASTITPFAVYSERFDSNLFTGNHLNIKSLRVTTGIATIGIATITSLNVIGVGSTPATISNLQIQNILSLPNGGPVYIGGTTTEEGFIGIGTDKIFEGTKLFVKGRTTTSDITVGLKTSTYSGTVNSGGLRVIKSNIYLENGTFILKDQCTVSVGNTEQDPNYPSSIGDQTGKTIIGLGTDSPRSVVDFSEAGKGLGTNLNESGTDGQKMRFMLPPSITTTQRIGLNTVEGAFIYNKTDKKHQGYNGTAWFDFY